jgi:replicative DNA helicase
MIVSLEMSKIEVEERIYCLKAEVSYTGLLNGTLTDSEEARFYSAKEKLRISKNPFFIYNPASATVEQIGAEIKEKRPDIVFIDFLDLVADSERGLNKKEATAKKSKALKMIARSEKLPVVVISHSNREFEKISIEREMSGDSSGEVYLPGENNIANADECGRDADLMIGLAEDKKKKKLYIGTVKGRFVKKNASVVEFDPDYGRFVPTIDLEDQVTESPNGEEKETFKKYSKK